jgi:DNA-directed RNA polymerases I, II, and III subunit RPABC1
MICNLHGLQLVPQHRILSDEDKQELLERYKLKEHQLPRLKYSDPIVQYYALKRGQVVKITRPIVTAGRYVTYRIVL